MLRIFFCWIWAACFAGFFLGVAAAEKPASPEAKAQEATALRSGLAAWWKLDETAGQTAADSSGHGRAAVLKGGLSFDRDSGPGRIGNALKLDGGDDFLEVLGYKGVTGTAPRTLSAWIKTTRPRGEILSYGLDDFGKMWRFGFIRSGVGVTPGGGYLYMGQPVHDDAWHHVVSVVEEADLPNLYDNVKLYKDGAPAQIDDIGLLDLWPVDTGGDLNVCIGKGFRGWIDDVRIYQRALSGDEVRALYQEAGKGEGATGRK